MPGGRFEPQTGGRIRPGKLIDCYRGFHRAFGPGGGVRPDPRGSLPSAFVQGEGSSSEASRGGPGDIPGKEGLRRHIHQHTDMEIERPTD
jgi:hypothetical protein